MRENTDLRTRLAEVELERDSLKEELEVGLQLTGSFFEALKPLKLTAIYVENPGRHVTDLIDQLAAMTQERDIFKKMWEVRGKALAKGCPACGAVQVEIKPKLAEGGNVLLTQEEYQAIKQQLTASQARVKVLEEACRDVTTCRRPSELFDVGSIITHLRQAPASLPYRDD